MSGIPVFEKILRVRENEKNVAQSAYHQSMDYFEEKATKLYGLLRKKEEAENSYQSHVYESIAIEQLKEHSAYMDHLNQQINHIQQQVILARNEMEAKQQELSEAYIEVKKFEKIIESKTETLKQQMKTEEEKWMDEISVQQYFTARSGE